MDKAIYDIFYFFWQFNIKRINRIYSTKNIICRFIGEINIWSLMITDLSEYLIRVWAV